MTDYEGVDVQNHTPFPLPDTFWAKTRTDPTGCIIWTAAKNNKGYGCFSLGGKVFLAHRLAEMAAHGPIPDGYHVDHLCRVRLCVNADHLEAVTVAENNRRMREALGMDPNPKPRVRSLRIVKPKPAPVPDRDRFVTHKYVHPVDGPSLATHTNRPYMRKRCPRCAAA